MPSNETEVVISVSSLSKEFKLPHQKKESVKSFFTGMLSFGNKSYETQHALKDISFDIKKGEFFGIVGRNGSGKSTMLKILAGIYQPTSGTVKVKGRLVPFIELGVGFNPELTGRENVYLNGALLGFSEQEVRTKYVAIVEFAEIEKFMDQKLKNYSSGMQVRLAFSVATVLAESDVLLIDEVLAVGDADFQRKCFEYFKDLKKNNKTVVLVSHDMNAIREYCDRVALIEGSKLVAVGKASKIATLYARMFTKDEVSKKGQSTKRWGDKKVEFTQVEVVPKKITDQKSIRIVTYAVANEDVKGPIFGIMVKNAASQPILGTNTQIKQVKSGDLKKGERISLEWDVPNVFADGIYYIDPAVVHDNGVETHDWWEEARSFRVYKEEITPYIITPKIEVSIIRDNATK